MIQPTYIYRARCERVKDGDTYVMLVDLGFGVGIRIDVRLHGWSCPELSEPTGLGLRAMTAATDILIGRFGTINAWPLVVQTYRDQQTFARWVADVYVDGVHIGAMLEAMGLARPGARVGDTNV